MSLLFIQNWDLIHGKESEYERFISDVFLPEITPMGLIPVGGYYVEVGFGPRILVVHTAEESGRIAEAIATKEFRDLIIHLKNYVCNYRRTILEPTGSIKRGRYTIQKGVWKFNQYYDLLPGMKREYAEFIINEHLPAMRTIDYVEVTGGWNVVLGGFSEIVAEFTFRSAIDIGRLLGNEDFQRVTQKLKRYYVTNYMSRIMHSTERFDEPKWFKM